jgi:hypothetical protein
MKNKLLLVLVVVSSQFLHSQTEKKVRATVLSNNFALQGIDVINLVSKKTVITNSSGNFAIWANVGDKIMFVSKNYEYKTIVLKEEDLKDPNLVIQLIKKAEELDEVVIQNKVKAPLIPNMQQLLDTQVPDDAYSQKKNPFGTDGSITYGPDIIRIMGKVVKLFTKPKDKKSKEVYEKDFKTLAESKLDQVFFSKYLKLNANEIASFLEFCEADSKSKNIIKNANELELMDFLLAKNNEFKKLQRE